jgi:hypothetical protein
MPVTVPQLRARQDVITGGERRMMEKARQLQRLLSDEG